VVASNQILPQNSVFETEAAKVNKSLKWRIGFFEIYSKGEKRARGRKWRQGEMVLKRRQTTIRLDELVVRRLIWVFNSERARKGENAMGRRGKMRRREGENAMGRWG